MSLASLATVLVAVAFVGLCVWVLLPRNKERLERQGQIPFEDSEQNKKDAGHD